MAGLGPAGPVPSAAPVTNELKDEEQENSMLKKRFVVERCAVLALLMGLAAALLSALPAGAATMQDLF